MMKIIKRGKYISKVRPFINKNIIKVFVGARRTGKTYLLYQIIDEIKNTDKKANIIYINKEEHDFRDITNDQQLFDYVAQNTKNNCTNYLFIDEIQEIEHFEIALRELLIKNYDIYCTGSNARMLSTDLATFLSGRYIEIHVSPLCFSEFLDFYNLDKSKESLLKYIKYGGLPFLINLQLEDEIVYNYLKSVYNTIILKDVVSRYNIRDVDFLERLVEYLSDNLGSFVSSKKITEFIKSQRISLSSNTVMNYLQYLKNSFFIDNVKRYDLQGKKIFEINEKFYFSDLGLKHSIIPYNPNDFAKILENLVYNKLIYDEYHVLTGKMGNKEIDFVAKKENQTLYVQVTYLLSDQKVIDREFGNMLEIKDNYRKIVVSADDFAQGNYKGIEHVHILDFLTT